MPSTSSPLPAGWSEYGITLGCLLHCGPGKHRRWGLVMAAQSHLEQPGERTGCGGPRGPESTWVEE